MKVIKNLLIIVVLFDVCLIPLMILCMVMSWNPAQYETQLFHSYNVFMLLYGLNSGMNPVVYALKFRQFRVALKLMFGCIKAEGRSEAISDAMEL